MSEAELHVMLRLLVEKTALLQCSSMELRAAFELLQQRGYRITPPKPE
jgi:hypothetical protein